MHRGRNAKEREIGSNHVHVQCTCVDPIIILYYYCTYIIKTILLNSNKKFSSIRNAVFYLKQISHHMKGPWMLKIAKSQIFLDLLTSLKPCILFLWTHLSLFYMNYKMSFTVQHLIYLFLTFFQGKMEEKRHLQKAILSYSSI